MNTVRWLSWSLYIVGTALVLGSYVRVVPVGVGWIGWGIGMLGWVIGLVIRSKTVPSIAYQLEKLERLRKSGSISDAEYETAKAKLLG